MKNNALSVGAPADKKNGLGKTLMLIARLVVVYYLVSLFFGILDPLGFAGATQGMPLKDVFGNIDAYAAYLSEAEVVSYAYTTMNVVAYVMLVALVLMVVALVLSFFDGVPKKVAVTSLAILFLVSAVGSALAGVFSFTLKSPFVDPLPYAFILAGLFVAAAICCIIALKAKDYAPRFDKNVDPSTVGGKLTGYFAGSIAEIKKIVWPDKKTVARNTAVVLLFILLLGVVIWGLDLLWTWLFKLILSK